ncbi:MAG: lysylphosphatidylglycerol synthase transmembrane domain-containing protein [bacterium]|nr:lysylphosphatidylglycerol synthase transmembrane domain-containing protein [bacterium]
MNKKDIIKYLIFAAVGALVVYFILKNFDFEAFKNTIQKAKIHFVIISVLGGVLAVLLRALRWQLLLKPMGYKTKLSNAYHSTMSGYLVNLGIPRAGEVSRCALMAKTDNIPVNVLVGTVVSERILDLIMLALVITSTVILEFDLLYNYIDENVLSKLAYIKGPIIITFLILIMGAVFLFRSKKLFKGGGKIAAIIQGFADGLKSVFTVQKPILFILYTVGIWFCYWMMTYFVLQAFDFTEHLGVTGGLCTLVFTSLGVIIPAPAGIATIKSVEIGLFQIFSLPIIQSNAVGIVLFFSNIIMIIIAGTISFLVMAYRTKV